MNDYERSGQKRGARGSQQRCLDMYRKGLHPPTPGAQKSCFTAPVYLTTGRNPRQAPPAPQAAAVPKARRNP